MELYENGRLVDSGTPRVWELTDFTAGVRNTEQVAFQMNRALSIIDESNVIQSTRPTMMNDGTVRFDVLYSEGASSTGFVSRIASKNQKLYNVVVREL